MSGRDAVARDLVVVACAISAGVHAALAPAHFQESAAAGTGFAVSAVLLALLATATRRPRPDALAAASLLLAGLTVAYALAVTTGIPILHSSPEPADSLGLFATTVELVGLGAALRLLARPRPERVTLLPKGTHT